MRDHDQRGKASHEFRDTAAGTEDITIWQNRVGLPARDNSWCDRPHGRREDTLCAWSNVVFHDLKMGIGMPVMEKVFAVRGLAVPRPFVWALPACAVKHPLVRRTLQSRNTGYVCRLACQLSGPDSIFAEINARNARSATSLTEDLVSLLKERYNPRSPGHLRRKSKMIAEYIRVHRTSTEEMSVGAFVLPRLEVGAGHCLVEGHFIDQ